MSYKILCSVIIPVYRCEKYLGQAIQSALDQTVREIEVLVVDDCSPDDSHRIALEFSQIDPRVRCLRHEKNLGVAQARNTGVRAAKGKWVAFLDADDIWLPDKLEKQFALLREKERVLCYTGAHFYKEEKPDEMKLTQVPEQVGEPLLRHGNVIINSSVLVKREVMLRYPMERSDLHEDYIAWLRILRDHGEAVGVNEPLVRYRILPDSKSGNKLRSAQCTWRTYRFMGWPFFTRLRCFVSYIFHGLKRYI